MSNPRLATGSRWLRYACAIWLLLLPGCASGPISADVGFGGSATPAAPLASGGPPGRFDGVYVGTANVQVNGSNGCRSPMTITAMRVDGNRLRFGGWRATIGPNGIIPATYFRGMWLTGQLQDGKFVGHVDASDDLVGIFSGCVYVLAATRQSG